MSPICGILRKKGFCNQADCALQHPPVCDICDGVRIIQDNNDDPHLLSRKHLRLAYERGVVDANRCSICTNVVFRNEFEFVQHYNRKRHHKQARAQGRSPYAVLTPTALRRCRPCNRLVQNQSWSSHLSSTCHRQKSGKVPTPIIKPTNTGATEPVESGIVELGWVSPDAQAILFRVQVWLPKRRDDGHIQRVSLSSRAQSA
jgi:phage FluMu protein Com